jgi:FAD:protein FMN transferase
MEPLTRRRFLQITAFAGVAATLPLPSFAAAASSLYHWRGILLGADASMQLYLPEKGAAAALMQRCLAEIKRLEHIFSLHDPRSSLSVLNRQGYLDAPPPELVHLLQESHRFSVLTDGAFDVTVQPLWNLYAGHFAAHSEATEGPSAAAIEAALHLVDYRKIALSPERVELGLTGMELTLNGIAQGYITDRITALLKSEGVERTLVAMGEMRALGTHPDGTPWKVGIRNPLEAGGMAATLPLTDRALATSGGYGTRFSETAHHLFDPRTGRSANHYASVSVLAPSATHADALSTGLCVLPLARAARLVQSLPHTEALMLQGDGRLHRL